MGKTLSQNTMGRGFPRPLPQGIMGLKAPREVAPEHKLRGLERTACTPQEHHREEPLGQRKGIQRCEEMWWAETLL